MIRGEISNMPSSRRDSLSGYLAATLPGQVSVPEACENASVSDLSHVSEQRRDRRSNRKEYKHESSISKRHSDEEDSDGDDDILIFESKKLEDKKKKKNKPTSLREVRRKHAGKNDINSQGGALFTTPDTQTQYLSAMLEYFPASPESPEFFNDDASTHSESQSNSEALSEMLNQFPHSPNSPNLEYDSMSEDNSYSFSYMNNAKGSSLGLKDSGSISTGLTASCTTLPDTIGGSIDGSAMSMTSISRRRSSCGSTTSSTSYFSDSMQNIAEDLVLEDGFLTQDEEGEDNSDTLIPAPGVFCPDETDTDADDLDFPVPYKNNHQTKSLRSLGNSLAYETTDDEEDIDNKMLFCNSKPSPPRRRRLSLLGHRGKHDNKVKERKHKEKSESSSKRSRKEKREEHKRDKEKKREKKRREEKKRKDEKKEGRTRKDEDKKERRSRRERRKKEKEETHHAEPEHGKRGISRRLSNTFAHGWKRSHQKDVDVDHSHSNSLSTRDDLLMDHTNNKKLETRRRRMSRLSNTVWSRNETSDKHDKEKKRHDSKSSKPVLKNVSGRFRTSDADKNGRRSTRRSVTSHDSRDGKSRGSRGERLKKKRSSINNFKIHGNLSQTQRVYAEEFHKWINVDPSENTIAGNTLADREIRKVIREHPDICTVKYEFCGTSSAVYPLPMLIAVGATVPVIKLCYEAFPKAITEEDIYIGSPIHYAVQYGASIDVLEYLLQLNPELIHATNHFKRTALHMACMTSNSNYNTVKFLLSKDKNLASWVEKDDNMPLHLAALSQAPIEVVEYLLQVYPLACISKTKLGFTPLHVAVQSDVPTTIIKLMIKAGPKALTMGDNANQTPLHIAVNIMCKFSTTKLIYQVHPGAKTVRSSLGKTPLEIAVSKPNTDEVVKLLSK